MALGKGLGSLIPQQSKKTKIKKKKEKLTVPVTHFDNLSQADHGTETKIDRLWQIPLSSIVPNPEQPRKHFSENELDELVASIAEYGVLQPVTVTECDDGTYELIAGERRFRSSQLAGKATIPAIVRSASRQEKLELALIENVQRENLNAIEEAFAYKRLMDEFDLTQKDVAKRVGKRRSTVANIIRLLDLPDNIQKALIDGLISTGKARAILSLKDADEQQRVFDSMMGKKMTVRDVEKEVAMQGASSRKGSIRKDPNIIAQEEELQDRFGTKVKITNRGEKGKIVIEYYSKEELKRLLADLLGE